jgi:hypothetical protein
VHYLNNMAPAMLVVALPSLSTVGCSSTEPDDGDEEEEVGEALRDLAAQ